MLDCPLNNLGNESHRLEAGGAGKGSEVACLAISSAARAFLTDESSSFKASRSELDTLCDVPQKSKKGADMS